MFGLNDIILKETTNVLQQFIEINSAVIFGSRARGDYNKTSDIDIAIFSNEITTSRVNLLRYNLDELDIIYKIDIVDFYKLSKQALKENIINEGIEIYKAIA